jgi:hypothetical protein
MKRSPKERSEGIHERIIINYGITFSFLNNVTRGMDKSFRLERMENPFIGERKKSMLFK